MAFRLTGKKRRRKTIDESTWNLYEFAIFLIHTRWRLQDEFLVAETTHNKAVGCAWQRLLTCILKDYISYHHPQFLNWIWLFYNFQSALKSTIFAQARWNLNEARPQTSVSTYVTFQSSILIPSYQTRLDALTRHDFRPWFIRMQNFRALA